MSVVRNHASSLRTQADEMRTRAVALRAQAEAMNWTSGAAQAFRLQIGTTADDLGRSAGSLDAAAEALEVHARAVDGVKALIARAEQWASERLDEARTIALNAVEVVRVVSNASVTAGMRVLNTVSDGVNGMVEATWHTIFGSHISESDVIRSRDIIRTVPTRPPGGSKEWFDVESALGGIR